MATNLRGGRFGETSLQFYTPSVVALAFKNGVVEYRNSEFKRFNGDDVDTLCENLVNFGPVNVEFEADKLRSLGCTTARHCGDQN